MGTLDKLKGTRERTVVLPTHAWMSPKEALRLTLEEEVGRTCGVVRACTQEPRETLCWALKEEVGCVCGDASPSMDVQIEALGWAHKAEVGRTCGVVCACVQEHHIARLALAEILQEALLVQAPCLRLVVAVLLLLHLGVPPDAAGHIRDSSAHASLSAGSQKCGTS